MDIKKIAEVIKIFKNHHYVAYLVGGSARDLLLSRDFSDIDIATNAPLSFIKQNFEIASEEGCGFGSVKIFYHKMLMEITLFRQESYDFKSTYPKVEAFVKTPQEDYLRRDFTINAIYVDVTNNEIIDPSDGLHDLFSFKIRLIGKKKLRLEEDPTRILRALRLAYKLNFMIEEETKKTIVENISLLERIKENQFHKEIQKMIVDLGENKTNQILELYHIERR